MMLLVASD